MKNRIRLPAEADMPAGSSSFIRWLGFFLKPYARTLLFFSAFRVIRFAIIAMLPLVVGMAIDGFEQGWAYDDPERLAWKIGPFLVLYGLAQMSMALFIREASVEDRLVRTVTLFSVQFMNRLPLSWHESQPSGSKLQRVMTARSSIKQLYEIYKWSLVPFIGSMVGITASVLLLDAPAWFLLLYIGFIASFCAAGYFLARKLPDLHDAHNRLLEGMLAKVYEFVGAVRTVKAFHMESHIAQEAMKHEAGGHQAMLKVYGATYLKWTVLNLIGFFWILAFLAACLHEIYAGNIKTGAFATIFFLAYNMWGRLEEIVYIQDQFIEYRNGFMRITETLNARPLPVDLSPPAPYPADWREIRFDRVSFAYDRQDMPALHDINVTIRHGEKVALVGPSGAGKSTFVKLLMKQMLPDHGQVMLDQENLSFVPSASWLPRLGLVPQDVELFNMSIRENILLDRAGMADEILYRSALEQSALTGLIDSLPDGDATMVGERGIKLSGGQRQRLGIARALVRQAEIIIFDEATSSLDSLSEKVIQSALESTFGDATMIIIAHRLSTVRFADRILVLDHGHLVEDGRFDELIERDGLFARMWRMQSGGFEPERPEAML